MAINSYSKTPSSNTTVGTVNTTGSAQPSELSDAIQEIMADLAEMNDGTATLTSPSISGNLTVSGTVDGRDVAADGTKLDGIESGATADQSASEILTLIKTVDGAGSGLDADLLDGISSASFLRSDAADTSTGTITSNPSSGANILFQNGSGAAVGRVTFDGSNLKVRGDSSKGLILGSNNTDVLTIDTSSNATFTGNINVGGTVDGRDIAADGSKLDGIEAGAAANQSASEILTAIKTVDGSGSGLDADLLDGYNSSAFVRSDADDDKTGFLRITDDDGLIIRSNTNGVGSKINFSDQIGTYAQNGTLTYKHSDGAISTTRANSNDGWIFEGTESRTVVKVDGVIESTTEIIAPIYYDSSNTSYYANPAGTSVFNALTVGGSSVLTGNQTITLSGDVTGSGTTSISTNIASNVVGASELNVSGNGTTSQFLRSDGDGTFTWATPTDTNTTYTANGAYGITLSGTEFRLENDRRRNSTTDDVYSGNASDYTFYDADVGIRWYTAGAEDMRLTDAGDLHVDGNVTAYSTTISDKRLKENIEPVANALDKIQQLTGYTFTYKNSGRESAGVIAQDIEQVMPSAVLETELPLEISDGQKYKTVQYDQLHALLIEAIKELTIKVERLENGSAK